jgi:hypothetical protein
VNSCPKRFGWITTFHVQTSKVASQPLAPRPAAGFVSPPAKTAGRLPDKYQVDLAIKARDAASWGADDDRAVRLEYLRKSFGGESTDSCVWAGCSRRALRGIAMCAEHAYDRAGVRAKGA